MSELVHKLDGDARPLDTHWYSAGGVGVRRDLVQAVLEAWASIAWDGDPATPLRSNGEINSVENLARIAAVAVASKVEQTALPAGDKSPTGGDRAGDGGAPAEEAAQAADGE